MAKSITKKLTTKEIAQLSECSIRTAERIKKQIKLEFKIKRVLLRHYNGYFLID